MITIITHGGPAHRDDFIACCVLLAHHGRLNEEARILRRDPTGPEMEDPAVYKVDVGGAHDPALRAFDHHQMPRDAAPTCALSLVLRHLDLEATAIQASPWFRFTEMLDSKGPTTTQAAFGISPAAMTASMSPVEAQVIRRFGRASLIRPVDLLYQFMVELGDAWLDYWEQFRHRMELLHDVCQFYRVQGRLVADVRAVGRTDPTLAVEAFFEAKQLEPDVVVSCDDRGDGYSLYRRNDAPGVDFSRLEGMRETVFAHKNGFIAKVKRPCNVLRLIDAAIE